MELRQLEYFREIANTGSINEAARKLNMSQPPLSYQIRQLENELNVQLFERTHKGVILTAAGKLLYDRAASLLDYARSTELEVSQTGKKKGSENRDHADDGRHSHAVYRRIFKEKSRREF